MRISMLTTAALLLLAACNQQDGNRPPEAASSAAQSHYAEDYPEALDEQTQDFDSGVGKVQETSAKMPGYSEELSDPTDHELAADVVRTADEAGRSEAYVQAARERDAVTDFLEADDGAVTRKVAGGVGYAAEQQGCKDMSGAAAGALKRAVDKALEEKMRDANEAHVLIDRYEDDLGKQNAEKLRTQADEIAEASYVAFIELPTKKYQLERMIEEGSTAKATLEREIEDEERIFKDPDASTKEKDRAEARIAKLEESRAKIDDKVEAARQRQRELEQQVLDAQAEYNRALDDLLAAIEDKAKNAPAAEGKA